MDPLDAAGSVEMFIQMVGRWHTYSCIFGCSGQLHTTRAEAVDAFLTHRCEMGG